MVHRVSTLSAASLILTLATAAFAQRADDNVTAQAEDAFGRSVGNERLGIYNVGEVRGFSPIDAGNVRIEGLYFDRQTDPAARLVDGSTIRVGIAAQSYPFPSPTGIVDYDLRRVGAERVISPVLSYGPFGTMALEVDAQLPLAQERFGVALGADIYRSGFPWGGEARSSEFAIIPRWRPTANIELVPFYTRIMFSGEEPQQLMLTAQGALPPKYARKNYFGQKWAHSEGDSYTYGFMGNAHAGEWTIRLGLFDSIFAPDAEFADLYTDLDATGVANEQVVAFRESHFESRSGELRISRSFEETQRRHTFHFSTRGRLQQRRFGGEDVVDIGPVQMGVGQQIPKPEFQFGEQTRDEVRQATLGVAYEMRWKDRGELSLGAQKTRYAKDTETPTDVLPTSRAHPFLFNGTATLHATRSLAFYASYTEGLEESPVAPENAVNRNSAAPALRTDQYDAGLRWAIRPELKLIAGIFNIEKPYFDLDNDGVFTSLGDVRHHGVELSLAGKIAPNLTLVTGARIMDAKLSGGVVDQGEIGARPVASYKRYAIGSVEYVVPGTGFSFDAVVESISPQIANTANTVRSPGRTVAHLGGRYRFTMFDKPATLRAQVGNIFDKYGWSVISGGIYTYNSPRRLIVYLAMDL